VRICVGESWHQWETGDWQSEKNVWCVSVWAILNLIKYQKSSRCPIVPSVRITATFPYTGFLQFPLEKVCMKHVVHGLPSRRIILSSNINIETRYGVVNIIGFPGYFYRCVLIEEIDIRYYNILGIVALCTHRRCGHYGHWESTAGPERLQRFKIFMLSKQKPFSKIKTTINIDLNQIVITTKRFGI